MKYAILMSLVGAFALIAGCSDDPKTGETGGNGGSESSSSSSSGSGSSSSSSGMGGAGGGSSSSSSSSSSSTSTSTSSSSSSGSMAVCKDATVVDKEDPTMRCKNALPGEVVNIVMAPPTMVWADKIDDFSSEYGLANYGSTQVKGAPDVYPSSGDEPKAWAQKEVDTANEFITVSYSTPVVADAVWVFETFNPGAISKITVTAADGPHVVYTKANPQAIGACSHVLSVATDTCSPISAVRIDLASDKVPDYNELDAVGLLPHK